MKKHTAVRDKIVSFFSNLRFRQTDAEHQEALKKFGEYLDHENPEPECFLCGTAITDTPYIHHVIPYFYIYKDDLWNLVYTHEACHREQADALPDEETIVRLEKRNLRLLKRLLEQEIMDQHVDELGYAIKYTLLRQEFNKCKGNFTV